MPANLVPVVTIPAKKKIGTISQLQYHIIITITTTILHHNHNYNKQYYTIMIAENRERIGKGWGNFLVWDLMTPPLGVKNV